MNDNVNILLPNMLIYIYIYRYLYIHVYIIKDEELIGEKKKILNFTFKIFIKSSYELYEQSGR